VLVDVLTGPDRQSATSAGCLYFSRSPEPGEQVELNGELLTVTHAWHKPDIHYGSAKFVILLEHGNSRAGGATPHGNADASSKTTANA
jgi:hypothetical protein